MKLRLDERKNLLELFFWEGEGVEHSHLPNLVKTRARDDQRRGFFKFLFLKH